jgi:ribosome biogenesis protein MAK21
MGGSDAADLLFKPGKDVNGVKARVPVNAEAFWTKKVEDVPVDEVFFHNYFNAAGNTKKRTSTKESKKKRSGDDEEDSEDECEEEIWQAIANSKPEVDGDDEDDDLSMGDLESAYSDSDLGSEGGIDLGGGNDEEDEDEQAADDKDEIDDEFPEFESDDEAMFDDEDEVPDGLEDEDEEDEKDLSRSQKKRKERKKLKSLPTFASAEEYAKLLGADDDNDDFKI